MNEPAFNHEFPVTDQEMAGSFEPGKSTKILWRYWNAAYMKRNSSQKFRELSLFREGETVAMARFEGGRRKCPCTQHSRSHRDRALSLNQAEGRKFFHVRVLRSNIYHQPLIDGMNRWTISSKKRNSCAAKSVRRTIEMTKRCWHAGKWASQSR
jgi:hypothetical protein